MPVERLWMESPAWELGRREGIIRSEAGWLTAKPDRGACRDATLTRRRLARRPRRPPGTRADSEGNTTCCNPASFQGTTASLAEVACKFMHVPFRFLARSLRSVAGGKFSCDQRREEGKRSCRNPMYPNPLCAMPGRGDCTTYLPRH